MNNKTRVFVCVALITCFCSSAQNLRQAAKSYDSYAYQEAIDTYELMIKDGKGNQTVYEKLGDAYYNTAKYKEAAATYEKLFALEEAAPEAEYMYRYATTLKSAGDYEKSNQWMQKFAKQSPTDARAMAFMEHKDYISEIAAYAGNYAIKNVAINSTASDFAPAVYKEQLVFSSSRAESLSSSNISLWNNEPFQQLYSAVILEGDSLASVVAFSKELNSKAHETTTTFSKDGETVYFTRNNFRKGKFRKDGDGISRLKIYKAIWQDDKWKGITALPFCSDSYSTAHPALSADEKRLYFASNMPGTIGGTDIFYVDILEDGTYGTPVNLGPEINTKARETFPFITASNMLYFASDGGLGLGGLDIFATQLYDTKNDCVVNMGEPINSAADDFAIVLDKSGKKGYFSSNREGGIGSDDIYSFKEEKPFKIKCIEIINGTATDTQKGKALANAMVKVFNKNNELVAQTVSDANGDFKLEPKYREGSYRLTISKDGYEDQVYTFDMTQDRGVGPIKLGVIPNAVAAGTDLCSYLNISPVYFDFDNADIRDDAKVTLSKIANYMKTYPSLQIEIRAYTDAKGPKNYNLELSKRRAEQSKVYLIKQDINPARIIGKGFGETNFTNDCAIWKKCTEEEHKLNRRSEFYVK